MLSLLQLFLTVILQNVFRLVMIFCVLFSDVIVFLSFFHYYGNGKLFFRAFIFQCPKISFCKNVLNLLTLKFCQNIFKWHSVFCLINVALNSIEIERFCMKFPNVIKTQNLSLICQLRY